jgi:heme exporter protein D
MYFDSLNAVLTMGGHGAYVWSVYLLTAIVIAGALIVPVRRSKRVLRQLAAEQKRTQNLQAGSAGKDP